MTEYKAGDVVRYEPELTHCCEGIAIGIDCDGVVKLFDTYWGSYQPTVVTDPKNAELLFNLNDYNSCDYQGTWAKFHPDNRKVVTHQHGLQRDYYVRKGAVQDLDTQIKNAQVKVEDAEQELRSAKRAVNYAIDELNALLNRVDES